MKATLLRPVVHGLVHSDGIGEIIVRHLFEQAGFDRYKKLLARLFHELLDIDIARVARADATEPLLKECTDRQTLRNAIIHQGERATAEQAEAARLVAVAVFELVVYPMLYGLGLQVIEHGEIALASSPAKGSS